jgi:hypothetical protein
MRAHQLPGSASLPAMSPIKINDVFLYIGSPPVIQPARHAAVLA